MSYEDALQLQIIGMMKMVKVFKRIRERDGPISAIVMMCKWQDWFDRTEAGRKLGELYSRQYALILRSWR
jgi:hypothetical protein